MKKFGDSFYYWIADSSCIAPEHKAQIGSYIAPEHKAQIEGYYFPKDYWYELTTIFVALSIFLTDQIQLYI